MEPEEIVKHLQQIPLFQENFEDKSGELELYRIVPQVNEAEYEPGEWLCSQGQPATRLYLILEGKVRLTRVDRDGITRHLGDLEAGSSFGETGLLVEEFEDYTAEALVTTRVLYLERSKFAELLNERPRLRRRLRIKPELAQRQRLPHYAWQREGEITIAERRRHWAYLVRGLLAPVLLFLLLSAFIVVLSTLQQPLLHVIALIVLLPWLGLLAFITWKILDWSNDLFVLTTERVVHFEKVWPFWETFEEGPLDNVQDIHEIRAGLTPRLLNYGNLILQTAGETVQIDLTGIPQPGDMREKIFREIERRRARQVLQTRGAIRDLLQRRLRLEPPPALPPAAAPPKLPHTPLFIAWSWFWDFVFPPSWVYNEDKTLVSWRRYWLPGFVRYLASFVPLTLLTLGGIYYFATQEYKIGLLAVWLLVEAFLLGALLWQIEDWRNDYFQVTPTRLIVVERKPFLIEEKRRETTLDRIQNISYDKPSLWARLFKYGTVVVETAGTAGRFELTYLRFPEKVQAEISKRQREYGVRQRAAEAQRRQEELLSWFATYDSLRGSTEPTSAQPGPVTQ